MRLRKKPKYPTRKYIKVNIDIQDFNNLKELIDSLPGSISLKDVEINVHYDNCYLTFERYENDLEYNRKIEKYNREVEKYEQWASKNKELIEMQIEKEKDILLKRKQEIESKLKQLNNFKRDEKDCIWIFDRLPVDFYRVP